ncbi:MAG: hypothetical protein ACXWV0_06485 [Flavisolibacter sp.]
MEKAYETSGSYLFGEKQRFPKWLSLLMIIPVAITAGLMLFLANQEEADKIEMWVTLAIVIPMQLILFILFRKARLEKVVTTNGFYYRWLPVQSKFRVIEKDTIREAFIRRAPSINYGSNWVPGYGRVHMAKRGDGIDILKADGKRIFFSSDDPQSLLKALQELIRSNRKTRASEF